MSYELMEVTVSTPGNIETGTKSIYFPAEHLKRTTTTGIQLLSTMQIPDLIVDPSSGSINMLGGGELQIRINGRPSTQTEIMQLSPKDISRVEFIPHPGARYGNAKGILLITVKRISRGYQAMSNLLQSPNKGWGDYTASVKTNLGNHEIAVSYHGNPMWKMDCYRNNYEYITLADETHITRSESGIKTPNTMITQNGFIQYSYTTGQQFLFNIKADINHINNKLISSGNIVTNIGDTQFCQLETERNPFSSLLLDLDIYLHWKFSQNRTLYVNIVPSYMRSKSRHSFDAPDFHSATESSGDSKAIIGESFIEWKTAGGSITAGVRSRNSIEDACIYESDKESTSFTHGKEELFGEWVHRTDRMQLNIGAYAALDHTSITGTSNNYFSVNPRIMLSYQISESVRTNFALKSSTISPTVNQINPASQTIDAYQTYIGNTHLDTYMKWDASMETSMKIGRISGKLKLQTDYCNNPIANTKRYSADRIIVSPQNSGHNIDISVSGQIQLPVIERHLTISLDGGWHTAKSSGADFSHHYSQPFINAQLTFTAGKWWAFLKYNNSYNWLWGEMIESTNTNLTNIGAGYTHKSVTFMAGIVNPVGNVAIKSKDLSEIASFDRTYQAANSSRLVWIGVSFNITKGKKRSSPIKRIENQQTIEPLKTISK